MNQEHKSTETKKVIREFTDLKAWQEAHKLVLLVHKITKAFPKEEIFGLTSQMRRASVSISSNISEGFGKRGYKEKLQFFNLSHGSIAELKNQVIICLDIKYLSQKDFDTIMDQIVTAHRLLQGLITKTKTFI